LIFSSSENKAENLLLSSKGREYFIKLSVVTEQYVALGIFASIIEAMSAACSWSCFESLL